VEEVVPCEIEGPLHQLREHDVDPRPFHPALRTSEFDATGNSYRRAVDPYTCLPKTIKAIGQGLPIFGLGKDRMLVANVLVAPDALV